RGALEEIPFGVATTREGTILYANEALARIFGAAHGTLENKRIAQLFSKETYGRIAERLDEARVFDGRVATRGFDGRSIDVEVHIGRYGSEARGMGGFLVVRDVSVELGSLGRLVDHLGGALSRIRVGARAVLPSARQGAAFDGAVEMVSPSIVKLT